jgi:hypothetical protein
MTNTFLRNDATFASVNYSDLSGSAGGVSSIAGNTGAFTLGAGLKNSTNVLLLDPSYMQGFLGGLGLSNDGTSPNTVIDIASGACVDSTNATLIKLAAFTKSTAGAWTAGSGNDGMGKSLTIANTTWYHVFTIINSGSADVYFDTSASAANAPTGTTAFRRIGSFLTNGSAHIIAFYQVCDDFWWLVPVNDVSATNPGTSAVTRTLTVPAGVVVEAHFEVQDFASATNHYGLVTPLAITDSTPSSSLATYYAFGGASSVVANIPVRVLTNTSSQIRTRQSASGSSDTLNIYTHGWRDCRGAG